MTQHGKRHAEIAGAGFAGLAAAIALAQRGWTVRVHERRSLRRPEGYGLTLHRNGTKVLTALGLRDVIEQHSIRIIRQERYNQHNECVASIPVRSTFRVSRYELIMSMIDRARELGVEVLTESVVAAARPQGELILEDGTTLKADLVVGTDGYNSRVRDSLGLHVKRVKLGDCAARTTVPRRPHDEPYDKESGAPSREFWSGSRRLLIGLCSPTEMFFTMSCLVDDHRARTIPINAEEWKRSFPHKAEIIERVVAHADWSEVMFAEFERISLDRWFKGHVAIVGDAAHAMPPNLGQGAGVAMMNAWALAYHLDEDRTIEDALTQWEKAERPLTEHTQRWSCMYSATTRWPNALRSLAMSATARIGWLRARYQRTALSSPRGCVDFDDA